FLSRAAAVDGIIPPPSPWQKQEPLSGDQLVFRVRLIGVSGGVRRASVWSGAKEPLHSGSDVQKRDCRDWRDARNCALSGGLRFCTRRLTDRCSIVAIRQFPARRYLQTLYRQGHQAFGWEKERRAGAAVTLRFGSQKGQPQSHW